MPDQIPDGIGPRHGTVDLKRDDRLPVTDPFLVPHGDEIYLQWYPEARQGWSTDLAPPEQWDKIGSERIMEERLQQIGVPVRDGLSQIVPELHDCELLWADAGTIFSWGETDVDQPDSEFHERYRIGVDSYHGELEGYYSIDTGKFTSGPLFAEHLRCVFAGEKPPSLFASQLQATFCAGESPGLGLGAD